MREYSFVGKRLADVDGIAKVTGEAQFTDDITLPKMLHGKILRSKHPHAFIRNIDITRAMKLSGVKAIITGRDIPKVKFGVFPPQADQFALAIDKVRYIGDDVAAVAAVDEETAAEAISLIEVDYEPLPAVFDPVEAMAEGAPQLHDHAPRNISVHATIQYGDVEKGFRESDYVREDTFTTEAVAHCQLEPFVALASFQTSGKLDIWTPNQSPFVKRRVIAKTLGVPTSDVRVHRVFIGGAFGGRSEMMALDFCAAFLSHKTGCPVKIAYSREESFTATRQKHPTIIWLKTGVKQDGYLVAKEFKVIADGGAYNSTAAISVFEPLICLLALYRFPNVKYDGYRIYTNRPIRGAMRGMGSNQIRFADESQLDIIAEELGLDPVQIRLINAVQTGEKLLNNASVTSCGLTESIEKAAAAIKWKEKRGKMRKISRGVGMGCAAYVSGYGIGVRTSSAAFIKFNEDGSATLITGAVDNGQGNYTMLLHIAAEEIGLPPHQINVVAADTEVTPLDAGAYIMQTALVSGNAVRLAAADARRQLLRVAAEKLESREEDLKIEGGQIFVKGSPSRALTIRDAIWAGLRKGVQIFGKASYMPEELATVDWMQGKIDGQVTGAYTYGAVAVEVEVDDKTGKVEVLRNAIAHDCGFAINRMAVEGQCEGGALMGQGQALLEEVVFEEAQILNSSFLSYNLPLSTDAPEMNTIIVESTANEGPSGAKSAADSPIIAMPSAIANAIYDAIGVRIKSIPITPEKVLKALTEKRNSTSGK